VTKDPKPMDPRRRSFLRGRLAGASMARAVPRPPWALDEAAFSDACTRCGDCVKACPQQVLRAGDGGYPQIHFDARGCTFCGECVRACTTPALSRPRSEAPWSLKASIGAACLALQRIECRVCGERCDARAIRFRPTLGGVAQPVLDAAACTGCGDCVAPCPTRAITVAVSQPKAPVAGTRIPDAGSSER
jgi:ferredoxin-type protein NapF